MRPGAECARPGGEAEMTSAERTTETGSEVTTHFIHNRSINNCTLSLSSWTAWA